ncbi:ribbon-helix-helix domain-containing protein [Patescibacteria group bacterium]|nr:ribbon-helix-helix domain-containing protein [Patescibacteria group bacterium]MBU1683301.1 ribbon-helix-helix domain-containing protein [Patescibacteria group bacterium]MBU1934618.1 ribbon-helix-helix domain-containing protein [Patescibacteria group bacterium]
MPKTIFNISEELMKQIDKTIKKWGFKSRAEFFRFAAIDFIRNDARFMPSDDILKDHTKAIKSVKARQIKRI